MPYETVIGIEVHAELDTRTKLFCGCSTAFGAPPNSQTCPVCLGMPGTLPVMNRQAFEFALRAAVALNCRIAPAAAFDRKNYYYPDLPKNYQISQSDRNLGEKGFLDILLDGRTTRVAIWNVHLEEDAGKLIHPDTGERATLVDLNRAGRPLLEIVSAPDMRSSAEVNAFMRTLRSVLLYTGVSDCKMQEGKLRFEPSISLRPEGSTELGARIEIKNVGSISAVVKAVEYEARRQAEAIDRGETLSQETRLWDERLNRTLSMRRKETAADYRYFPDPDLVEIEIDDAWLQRVRETIPELPTAKRLRFRDALGLSAYDAEVLADDRALADYFEAVLADGPISPSATAKWVINDLLRWLNENAAGIADFPCPPAHLAALVRMQEEGKLTINTAREVFSEMVRTGADPVRIVENKGLTQISDGNAIAAIVDRVLLGNPQAVADWQAGKKAAFNALIGPVMRETKGKANPKLVREALMERLEAK